MKKEKKYGILHQFMSRSTVFMLVFTLIMLIAMLCIDVKKSIAQRDESTRHIADYTASYFEQYRCIGRIIRYMCDNYEDMVLVTDKEEIEEREKLLSSMIPNYSSLEKITADQFDKLPEDLKMLYTEVCYTRFSAQLERITDSFDIHSITVFVSDGDQFFYIAQAKAKEENKSDDDDVSLGMVRQYKGGRYPALDEIIKTGKKPADRKRSILRTLARRSVHSFSPVYDKEGNLCMIVASAEEWEKLIIPEVKFSVSLIIIILSLILYHYFQTKRLLYNVVVRPVQEEQTVLAEYMRDKDSQKASEKLLLIKPENELQDLAEDFSNMALELHKYSEELIAASVEKEHIGVELGIARSIQESQLPEDLIPLKDPAPFEIGSYVKPAKEIGGDFFDYFYIDDDHILLFIADVSGKGIPGGLYMMRANTLIRFTARQQMSPAEILRSTNELLNEGNSESMFVTAWIGILELSSGKLTYADAGHENPAYFGAGKWTIMRKTDSGLPLGVVNEKQLEEMNPEDQYTDRELIMAPGDILLQYTDGITEAENPGGDSFGEDGLLNALNACTQTEPKKVISHLKSSIESFMNKESQFDDITMLCIKYKGDPK